jgi:4-aminobutyrate aminotransferase-like enzyme
LGSGWSPGLFGHVIRIAPQMLMSEDELAEGLERLARACRKVT